MKHSFVLVDNDGNTYRKIATSFNDAEKAVISDHGLEPDAIKTIERGEKAASI